MNYLSLRKNPTRERLSPEGRRDLDSTFRLTTSSLLPHRLQHIGQPRAVRREVELLHA
jgi:hypothetical protein